MPTVLVVPEAEVYPLRRRIRIGQRKKVKAAREFRQFRVRESGKGMKIVW
jgi:hypothetical protein